jgi:hypothetical protein
VSRRSESGAASLQVLLLLGLLSALGLGAAAIAFQIMAPVRGIRAEADARALLARLKAEFTEACRDDATPESDSRFDACWRLDGRQVDGWTVSLEDASSRLNLNWIHLNILENTALKTRLKDGRDFQELLQHREDIGYVLDFESAYADYFDPADCRELFSPWGPANVNLSFAECLEDLYRFRLPGSGDPGGFRAAVEARLVAQKPWTAAELEAALGVDAPRILPFMNTVPSLNVNYAPPALLGAVLAYPFPTGALPNPVGVKDKLLRAREEGELSPAWLEEMVRPTNVQQERLRSWLGTRTAVWRLSVARGGAEMSVYIGAPEKRRVPAP